MMIDTSKWQPFKLSELFNIKKGKRLTKEDQTEGTTPYIGAIDSNNGVSSLIGQTAIHEGKTISLSYNGSVGEAFYQPWPFWATDDVNVLYPKFQSTPNIALFICTLLRQEKYRFCYGRKWTLEMMLNSIVKLPITENGAPDWDWIENYMRSLNQSEPRTQNPSKNTRLQTNTWKTFVLSDILQIINGKGITSEEIDNNPGNLEAVQSGETNNGVIGFIDKSYCQTMGYSYCEQPCLSLARTGSAGFVSYHAKGCVVGDSAKILLLKHQVEDPHTAYLFLQTLLTANRFKYTYGRKVTETLYEKTVIKLPVNDNGQPDWHWIKNYIKSLPYGDCL